MVLTRSKAAKHDDNINHGSTTTSTPVKRKANSSMTTPPQAKITKMDVAPDLTTFKAPPESTPGRPKSPTITAPTVPPPTPTTTPAALSTPVGSDNNLGSTVPPMITDPAEIDLLLSLVPPTSSTTTATTMPYGTQDPVLEAVKEPTPVDMPLPEVSTVLADLPEETDDVPTLPPFSHLPLAEPSAPPFMMATATASTGSETAVSGVAAPSTAFTMPENPPALTTPSLPPAPADPVPVPTSSSKPLQSGRVPTVEDTFVGSSLRDQPLQLLSTSEGNETLAPPPPPLSVMEAIQRGDCVRATTATAHPSAKSVFAGLSGGPDSEAQNKKDKTNEGAQSQPKSEPNSARREKGLRSGVSMIA
ncbi:hypothetical protein BGZ81_004795 [Podila clonocystis]|nr:hypothetical protein BGZ81_004795 [Podila clonocystis]